MNLIQLSHKNHMLHHIDYEYKKEESKMTYYIHSEYPNFFFYEKKRKKRKMNSLLDTISICLTINLIVSYKKGTLLSY